MSVVRRDGSTPDLTQVTSPAAFGRALTDLRERAGLTVRDAAARANMAASTVGGWFTGRHLPSVSQRNQDMLVQVLGVCGVTDSAEVERWVECWRRVRRPLGRRPAAGPAPYRGLESFQPEHADWFFGRDSLTGSLTAQVAGLMAHRGLVLVVGSSGSGKSSLLRAGLIPALCHDETSPDGMRSCQHLLFTPGSQPVNELATHLSSLHDMSSDAFEAELRAHPIASAERILRARARPLLIVVDQLEELFTVCTNEAERRAFVAALHALASSFDRETTPLPARVVAGLRADFYGHALPYRPLAEALQSNQVVVAPMSQSELREAITGPARKAKLDLEDGLIELLLRELVPTGADTTPTVPNAGSLPLLSHALLATWERGSRGKMTVDDYTATGGIHGAIAQTAESVYAEFADTQQDLARRLFLRLIQVGENTPDTRRRVQLDELLGQPDDDQHDETRHVLSRYVDQRLLTADVDTVEISHEALLTAWPRLREWINNDRAGLRLHRQLTEAARAWQDSSREPGGLYRGMRFSAATDWADDPTHRSELNSLERQFLDASVDAATAERARDRRRTRRLFRLVAALVVLVLLAGGLTVYSFQQRVTANHERDQAVSRQIAGTADRLRDSDPALAAQLSVAAYRVSPTVEARSSVIASSAMPPVTRMVRPNGSLQAVAVTPNGQLFAAAGATRTDTEILLWDLRNPAQPVRVGAPLTGHTGGIDAAAFSPDGQILATGSADRTVRLWNVADPKHPVALGQPLTAPTDRILTVEFSPDGATLAAGGADKAIRLWDLRDRDRPAVLGRPLTGASGSVQSVAFDPAGRLLAAADAANAVHLWNISDREHPQPTTGPLPVPSRVNTVAFTPDGAMLAAGSNDGQVRLWTLTDPSKPAPVAAVTGATGWVNAIAFSSDGRTIAVANADNAVQLVDMATRKRIVTLPHPEPVTAVAFRDNDKTLLTNSADSVARRWTIPGPRIPAADRSVTTLDFHPNGTMLADAGTDVRLWDVTDRVRPTPLGPALTAPPGSDRMGGTVAISPDGHTLAAGTRTGNAIVVWDITDPRHPAQLGAPITGHTALIEQVDFSPDGRTLASASDDGTVRLLNLADPRHPEPITTLNPNAGRVFMVAFSPDNRILAAATQSGTVALWDLQNPREPATIGTPLPMSRDYIYSVEISPDNSTLAAGSADSTVRLWDITNPHAPTPLGDPIAGPDGYMLSLAFSPDNRMLAAGSGTGQTWMWDITNRTHPQTMAILHAPQQTTWNLTFNPTGQTLVGIDGDILLWDTDPTHTINNICSTAGDQITKTEWTKHIPGAPYRPICP